MGMTSKGANGPLVVYGVNTPWRKYTFLRKLSSRQYFLIALTSKHARKLRQPGTNYEMRP